jgi:hypothetical protein
MTSSIFAEARAAAPPEGAARHLQREWRNASVQEELLRVVLERERQADGATKALDRHDVIDAVLRHQERDVYDLVGFVSLLAIGVAKDVLPPPVLAIDPRLGRVERPEVRDPTRPLALNERQRPTVEQHVGHRLLAPLERRQIVVIDPIVQQDRDRVVVGLLTPAIPGLLVDRHRQRRDRAGEEVHGAPHRRDAQRGFPRDGDAGDRIPGTEERREGARAAQRDARILDRGTFLNRPFAASEWPHPSPQQCGSFRLPMASASSPPSGSAT